MIVSTTRIILFVVVVVSLSGLQMLECAPSNDNDEAIVFSGRPSELAADDDIRLVEAQDTRDQQEDDDDEWAMHFPKGWKAAEAFAEENDLELLAEIIPDSNYFQFKGKRHHSGHTRVKRDAHEILRKIQDSEEVDWAEQQQKLIRTKRDFFDEVKDIVPVNSYYPRNVFKPGGGFPTADPFWNQMWYLNRPNGMNMNVEEAWALGYTGRGVAVTILDDGLEKDHPDLLMNYDPLSSTDINENDSDPMPRYDFSDSNRHGTRCAGQVAATYNNSECCVGIAYNSHIGGIRMLDGQVSDAVEARSLSFNPDHIDIYSSSWGPNDDGKTVDGPGKLATRAFKNGITRGRDGRGSIFVWASGNGGRYKDNCNCDGYATSIYTITISSTSESGNIPWYSEPCSSTLATTYSSGTTSERQIVTTDLHHGCTVKHTGTSASAPMAAAIIALALEANPELTWRDVQHIIVHTSKPLNLRAPDWMENAMGRMVSHSYGYGLMDAGAMVKLALDWKNVPKQEICRISSPYYEKMIPPMKYITVEIDVKDCTSIKHLEHVVVPTYVTVGRKRGDLRIYLQSPSGTRSVLLDNRPHDYSSAGFIDWSFMSVHHWGENPTGTWTLEIHNDAFSKWRSEAKFHKWSLELHGIRYDPNSEDYVDERFNVVREANLENHSDKEHSVNVIKGRMKDIDGPTEEAKDLDDRSKSAFDDLQNRGCVSKQTKCTKEVSECRTFSYRSVADVFCTCTEQCIEVASSGNAMYNLQCYMTNSSSSSNDLDDEAHVRRSPPPFYCQFIPFLSY